MKEKSLLVQEAITESTRFTLPILALQLSAKWHCCVLDKMLSEHRSQCARTYLSSLEAKIACNWISLLYSGKLRFFQFTGHKLKKGHNCRCLDATTDTLTITKKYWTSWQGRAFSLFPSQSGMSMTRKHFKNG